jgi:hypothetical protein
VQEEAAVSIHSTGRSKSAEKPGIGHNNPPGDEPDWLRLRTKISVSEAARLNGVSVDTFKRRYRHLILKISPRRDVVTLGDALDIGSDDAA